MRSILYASLLLLLSNLAMASPELLTDEAGIALRGVDPVSYFTDQQPLPGSAELNATHQGAVYYFSSAEHREMFLADPAKYLPAYGGYCAFGAAMGKKFPGDPEVWKVVDGQLYLNINPKVQTRWSEDIPGFIEMADGQWPEIKDRTPEELNN